MNSYVHDCDLIAANLKLKPMSKAMINSFSAITRPYFSTEIIT